MNSVKTKHCTVAAKCHSKEHDVKAVNLIYSLTVITNMGGAVVIVL